MMKAFLLLILISVSVPRLANASTLSGITTNNEGVRLFEKQRVTEAYSRFAQSIGELPFEARAHYNLAASYLANKEFEKALSEFGVAAALAEKNGDARLLFAARFNAGVTATELKQVDQALAQYQAALKVIPDSVETKTNIELLVQSQSGGGDSKDDKDKDKKDPKDGKDKKDKGDGKDKDQQKQPQPKDQEPQKNQPKPFDSKELTQQDAQRIMEELKRQEEEVRARFQNDHVRDVPRDKDW